MSTAAPERLRLNGSAAVNPSPKGLRPGEKHGYA